MTICVECKCPVESDGSGHADGCSKQVSALTFFTKGWECPKCGRVWGPLQSQCVNCNVKIKEDKP